MFLCGSSVQCSPYRAFKQGWQQICNDRLKEISKKLLVQHQFWNPAPQLSGTKIASQNRSDRDGGRKRARNHSAAEIAAFFASPAAKKSIAASDLKFASKSQEARSDHGCKSPQPRDHGRSDHGTLSPPIFLYFAFLVSSWVSAEQSPGNTQFIKQIFPFLGEFTENKKL